MEYDDIERLLRARIAGLEARVAELEASAKLTADAARAYRANPLDAYDHPESWRLLGELVDAALSGESKP